MISDTKSSTLSFFILYSCVIYFVFLIFSGIGYEHWVLIYWWLLEYGESCFSLLHMHMLMYWKQWSVYFCLSILLLTCQRPISFSKCHLCNKAMRVPHQTHYSDSSPHWCRPIFFHFVYCNGDCSFEKPCSTISLC